jgi:hypothetical protein
MMINIGLLGMTGLRWNPRQPKYGLHGVSPDHNELCIITISPKTARMPGGDF